MGSCKGEKHGITTDQRLRPVQRQECHQEKRARRRPEAGSGWRGLRGVGTGPSHPQVGPKPATPFTKTLATACPQGTSQPLTLLITDVAAVTFGLMVVLPGQEGALLAWKAGDVATRLCAGGCQEVPCGTQTGVRYPERALSSLFPRFLSLAPSSSSLPLPNPWSALTAPPHHPFSHSPAGQPLQQNGPSLFCKSWAQSHLDVLPWPWVPSSTRRAWGTGAAGPQRGCPTRGPLPAQSPQLQRPQHLPSEQPTSQVPEQKRCLWMGVRLTSSPLSQARLGNAEERAPASPPHGPTARAEPGSPTPTRAFP